MANHNNIKQIFAAALLIVCCPCAFAAETYTAQVVRVVDGDTIVVTSAKGEERIRVAEIDCPESGDKLGPAATAFTRALVDGQTVTLRTYGLDRYQRTLADVILPDGRDLAQELKCAGLALRYR